MGSEAEIALMKAKSNTSPLVVAVNGNKTCFVNLTDSVERTKMVAEAIKKKDFAKASELRGFTFQRNLDTFIRLSKLHPKVAWEKIDHHYTLAVINIGAPACGVNSAIRSFVKHSTTRPLSKIKVLGIQDGFEGFIKNDIKELDWKSVFGIILNYFFFDT